MMYPPGCNLMMYPCRGPSFASRVKRHPAPCRQSTYSQLPVHLPFHRRPMTDMLCQPPRTGGVREMEGVLEGKLAGRFCPWSSPSCSALTFPVMDELTRGIRLSRRFVKGGSICMLDGYTRWAIVFLIIFVLFFLLVPAGTKTTCVTTPAY